MYKKGFTLVELAIVLIIISLLIGGILVAQSMIDTSRITKQIEQIGQFDAAVSNFITTHNSIPGDSAAMGCTGSYCGNGRIDDGIDWQQSEYFTSEVANFWVQLQRSGFTQDGATFTATIPASGFTVKGSSRNSPQAAIDSKTGVIAGYTWMWGSTSSSASVYQFADYGTLVSSGNYIQDYSAYSITPAQALAIDKKIDNGVANTGNNMRVVGNSSMEFGASSPSVNCISGGSYTLSNTGKTCILVIRIMSGSDGMPNRLTVY